MFCFLSLLSITPLALMPFTCGSLGWCRLWPLHALAKPMFWLHHEYGHERMSNRGLSIELAWAEEKPIICTEGITYIVTTYKMVLLQTAPRHRKRYTRSMVRKPIQNLFATCKKLWWVYIGIHIMTILFLCGAFHFYSFSLSIFMTQRLRVIVYKLVYALLDLQNRTFNLAKYFRKATVRPYQFKSWNAHLEY